VSQTLAKYQLKVVQITLDYVLGAKIRQGVERNGELTEALKTMKDIADGTSWFRDTPHYWASASLPFAYALACVEVVYKSSEKARILYNLLEARVCYHWTNTGVSIRFGYSCNLVSCSAGKATLTNCRQAFLVLDSNDGVRIRFWDR